ncbi:MAG: SPOR domain-containing protein [Candidatus Competibacteraceae bacterium]|nr:SPOR domain-containing protein [Candidatus Competibacteraceae bacterium]MBK9953210.1 SPOR domain-containing protein [Candidatus Competibacteraceae bacterium]
MNTANWKIPAVLAATLLAALGLQAGAIKLMLNSASSVEPADSATAHPRAAPVAPAERHPAHPANEFEERAAVGPVPPTTTAKPAMVADPPHLIDPPPKSEPVRHDAAPETPKPPTVAPATAQPSAEAALLASEAKAQASNSHPASNPPAAPAPVAPAAPVAPSPEASAASEPAAEGDLQDSEWLKARDAKHYTVQIYSGKSMDTLKVIAAATASAEPQAYYSTGSRSGPWYSLVEGDYSDAASAQAAAAKLTVRTPTIKPWIRRFEEIQAKLR